MDKDSMPYLFSFSRYGTKCVIDGVINFNIYLRSTSRAMADREKKIGGGKYGNSNILRMKKNFLDKINNIFYSCKGLTIGEK